MPNRDVIKLNGLAFDTMIGAGPSEHGVLQRVAMDMELQFDAYRPVAANLAKTADYGRLIGELHFLMHACRFSSLETAADTICRYLLARPIGEQQPGTLLWVRVALKAPGTFASVSMAGNRGEYDFVVEKKPFGYVDVLVEHAGFGVYRLRISPGAGIAAHEHRMMDEYEMVLGSGLLLQGKPIAAGSVIDWPRNFVHRYDNPTGAEQTVLCVDCPPFDPDDEIELNVAVDELHLPPSRMFYPMEQLYAGNAL